MNDTTGNTAPPFHRGEALTRWFPHNEILERAVIFQPGYLDPRTGPNSYGRHGMEIKWLLRGPRGATQFLMYTDWVPGQKDRNPRVADMFPMAADLGYHARVPQYEGAEEWGLHERCEYLTGRCYYDGSGLQAQPVLDRFIRDGEQAIWDALEDRYAALMTRIDEEDL